MSASRKPLSDADQRRRDLAKIHIARAQLGMDEDVYQKIVKSIGRVDSAAKLSAEGRQRLLAHFVACGWRPGAAASGNSASRSKGARPTPAPESVPLVRRVRAQLISLGRLPDSYADAIAKQAFGVQFYEWCTGVQLWELTNMLTAEQVRRGVDTGPGSVHRIGRHRMPRGGV